MNNLNNRSAKTYELITKILQDGNLSKMDKIVFMALITFNGKDKIFPSREKIAQRISAKRISSISTSLNKLKKYNYITIIRRSCSSNIYKINGVPELYPDNKAVPSGKVPAGDSETERVMKIMEQQLKLRDERNVLKGR